jgi:hypothetical protein
MKSNLRIVGYLCTGTDYLRLSQFFFTDQIREGWLEDKSGIWTALCQEDEAADMVLHEQALEELNRTEAAYNAVIGYMLGKGYMKSPMEFLSCWNEGNFEALREEWPDAPEEIYLADILYKGETK